MGNKSSKIAVIAALTTFWPIYASSQQGGVATPLVSGQTSTTQQTTNQPTAAAQPTGGLQVDLNLATTLKYDDNFSLTPGTSLGDTYISDTALSFNISSVTRAYSLNVGGSGVLRFADIPGRSITGFEDPNLYLNYVASSANSRLSFDARYRHTDREFLDPFQIEREEQVSGNLIEDGGSLTRRTAGLRYETGLQGPVSFLLDLRHDDKDYSDVTNPRLFSTDQDKVQTTVTLRVSPVTRLRFSAALTQYDAEDSVLTDRRTLDYSVGVTQDIDPTLVLDAQLGYTDVDTTTTTGTAERAGATGALTLTKTLPNGSVYGTLSSTRNQNGERITIRFGRDLQLKTGTLSAALGVTRGDITGTTSWIGNLAYVHQLRSSSFSVNFSRGASTNNLSEDILNTRIGIGYGYVINPVSRIDLSLDWGVSEDGGAGAAPKVERTTLRATYSRQLTTDWNLRGGFILRSKSETGLQDADSNAVFVSLDRGFSFRP